MQRIARGRERLFIASCIAGGIAILLQVLFISGAQAASLSPSRAALGAGDWPTYASNNQRTGYNGSETTLNASNISKIKMHWSQFAANGVSVQPIEANGVVYWGSWDGFLHAFTTAGGHMWDTQIGTTSDASCEPPSVGVASTATYGSIGSTPVIFVGGGNARFYALNASNGRVIWSTSVGASPSHFIWDSPIVANNSVYIGVSSFGDCPLVQGQVLKLNSSTGAIQATFNAIPNGCSGNGIWGSPALGPSSTTLYVTTGNPGSCTNPGPYGEAVVALNASSLVAVNSWAVPSNQRTGDSDFGTTPTLFNIGNQAYLGAANKNGQYYMFNRDNLAAGPIWQTTIANNSVDCPQCGDGSIAPSAWDGSRLYVAGGKTTINGIVCKGSVRALNPSTGAILWSHCLQSGPVLGAVTAINGVVVVTQGQDFNVINSATGASLVSYHDGRAGSVFYGSPSISNGQLFVGNLDGYLYVFGL